MLKSSDRGLLEWGIYSFLSIIIGLFAGYALGWVWFSFRLFILGYGDSGPAWINTINRVIFAIGVIGCVIFGQVIFFKKHGKR
jgi:hypothetical protein